MKNVILSKKLNQKGGAILGTVFLMSALAFMSILMLLKNTEQTKIDHVKSIKKKSFELMVENLKTKFSNPHVCAAAFRGRRLTDVFDDISGSTGFLTSMIDESDFKPKSNSFNTSKNGQRIGGLIIAPPPSLPPLTIDPILPGFDNSLIRFESLGFTIVNNQPSEIQPSFEDDDAFDPVLRGIFRRTGAGSLIPPDEVTIRRFRANVNLMANVGIFGNEFYVTNLKNPKAGSVFTTKYVKNLGKQYPVKVYQNGGITLEQVRKGNSVTGFSYHWTEAQLRTMGITAQKEQLEVPLYFYVKSTGPTAGQIVDCFTDDSPARICELSGGIWRTRNPAGYECEPRNRCLTNEIVYAPTIAIARSECPNPFKDALRIGVPMNDTGTGSDISRTSYLCRWCNTNRY